VSWDNTTLFADDTAADRAFRQEARDWIAAKYIYQDTSLGKVFLYLLQRLTAFGGYSQMCCDKIQNFIRSEFNLISPTICPFHRELCD